MDLDVEALIRRISQADEAALAVLFAAYGSHVYSLTLRTLGEPALAQEATQDTFLKLWQNPAGWDASKGEFSSWLLTVARYTAIDRLRREQRRNGRNVALEEELISDEPDPSEQITEDGRLRDGLSQLAPEQRTVIELAYFRGLKHSEMAELLHLPLGTVKTRLRLGLIHLRKMLDEQS